MRKGEMILLRIALVALFMSYYGGATMFFHTHKIGSEQITHSHPYLPSAHHTHSNAAFHFIASITNLIFVVVAGAMVSTKIFSTPLLYTPAVQNIVAVSLPGCQLRAPPCY